MATALCNISPVCAYEARSLTHAAALAMIDAGASMLPMQAGDSPG